MMKKMTGHYDEAHDYLLRAWESVQGDREETSYWAQARVLLELGNVMMALGNYDDGLDFFERGAGVARDRGYDRLWRYHTLNGIRVLALLDQVEEAERRLGDLRRETEEEDDFALWMLLGEADVAWALGDHRAAERVYREAAEQFRGALIATDIWVILAERLEEIGQTERAIETWRRARESGRRTGNQYKYLIATLACAKHLLAEDQKAEAQLLLEDLVEHSVEVAPDLAIKARELLGMDEGAGGATQTGYSFLAVKRDGEWQA
jgi:tetratricopeptide (TPR) repeat protein